MWLPCYNQHVSDCCFWVNWKQSQICCLRHLITHVMCKILYTLLVLSNNKQFYVVNCTLFFRIFSPMGFEIMFELQYKNCTYV